MHQQSAPIYPHSPPHLSSVIDPSTASMLEPLQHFALQFVLKQQPALRLIGSSFHYFFFSLEVWQYPKPLRISFRKSRGREKYVLNWLITQTNKISFKRPNRFWMTHFEWFSIQFVFIFIALSLSLSLYERSAQQNLEDVFWVFLYLFSSSSLSFCKSRAQHTLEDIF